MVQIGQFLGRSGLINFSGDIDDVAQNKVVPVVNTIINLSALVAVIMLVVGGYFFITAAGNPEQISKGQKTLTAAIVGMIIVFLAKVIVWFVLDKVE
ncbi:MAG: hypothetical protein ACOX6Q_02795 [Candidatus Dojkabacteria bacterium]|jgi:hypothetical protein